MAYSPRTGLIYTPTLEICVDITAEHQEPDEGRFFMSGSWDLKLPPNRNSYSHVDAWDPMTGKRVWSYPRNTCCWRRCSRPRATWCLPAIPKVNSLRWMLARARNSGVSKQARDIADRRSVTLSTGGSTSRHRQDGQSPISALPRRRCFRSSVAKWIDRHGLRTPGWIEIVRLSVLDQSPIAEGSTAGDALRNTIDLARWAEQSGIGATGWPNITGLPDWPTQVLK